MLEVPELTSGNPSLQKGLNKLVKAEQKKLDKFDEKKAVVDNKLKLVGDLKKKFSEIKDSLNPFRTVRDFRELKGVSSDPNVVNLGAIDKNLAVPGSYDIEVVKLANTNSVMSYGFPDKDESEVGIGYVTFTTPDGEDHDVYINSENNTLEGVAKTINDAGVGVKAYVVNDGTDADEPWRLVMSGEKTGWRNDMKWAEFHMLDGDLELDLERVREANSAIIKFNGNPLMADSNTIKDLLPGVVFDLKRAKPGDIVKLEVKADVEKIGEKSKNMVEKLNAVLSFFQSQSQLGPDSRKDPTKALAGDTSLQAIHSRMRTTIQDAQSKMGSKEIRALRDVGIVFNRSGTLDFDAQKFQAKLESNFDEVAALVSGTSPLSGFAYEMANLADGVIRRGDGIMTVRETSLKSQVTRITEEKERKTAQAEERVEKIKGQFARAEAAVEQMKSYNPGNLVGSAGGG